MTAPDTPPEGGGVLPGPVWWCDGVSLGFEAHFKRRPVLVLAINENGSLLVAPLSSRRYQGQEQAVTHEGGISYLTGRATDIPAEALLSPLGSWEGFEPWRAAQQQAADAAGRVNYWLARLRRWLTG